MINKNQGTIMIDNDLRKIFNQMKVDRDFKSVNDLLWSLIKEEKQNDVSN